MRHIRIKEAGDSRVDRVHLSEGTNAEQANAHSEEREDLCEPAPGNLGQTLLHAALDVVERAAEHMAVFVDAAILHGEQALGILRCHSKQRGEPHPEHRARAAGNNSRRNAHDVARADGGRKRRAQRAEARYLAMGVFALFVLHHVAKRAGQPSKLQAAQAHGQQNAAGQNENHQRHAPNKIVDGDQNAVHRGEKLFHNSSFLHSASRNDRLSNAARDTLSESEGTCEYKEINRRRAVAGMRMHEYLQQAAKLLCPFA